MEVTRYGCTGKSADRRGDDSAAFLHGQLRAHWLHRRIPRVQGREAQP